MSKLRTKQVLHFALKRKRKIKGKRKETNYTRGEQQAKHEKLSIKQSITRTNHKIEAQRHRYPNFFKGL